MVYRAGAAEINLEDEDEEEELSWDADPAPVPAAGTTSAVESSTHGSVGGTSGIVSNAASAADFKVLELKDENDRLKAIVKTLTGRVTDLEQQLSAALRENETQAKIIASLKANPVVSAAERDEVSKSSSHDSNKGGNNADNVSQCSGDSGIVLHNSDTMSFPDEDSRHGVTAAANAPGKSNGSGAFTGAAADSSSITSKTTRAYLAAVDDNEEDELDGWS